MKVMVALHDIFESKGIDVMLYPNDYDVQVIEIQKEEK